MCGPFCGELVQEMLDFTVLAETDKMYSHRITDINAGRGLSTAEDLTKWALSPELTEEYFLKHTFILRLTTLE